MVGQNLLTSRQPSTAATHFPPSPQKPAPSHHPGQQQQQQQQQRDVTDDWQQTISMLQTPALAPTASKPLCKQLSKDLFQWLSETEQKTATQPVLPQITQKPSPLKVCYFCAYHYKCSNNNNKGQGHMELRGVAANVLFGGRESCIGVRDDGSIG